MMTRFEQDCMQVQTESLRKLAGIMVEVMKDLGRIADSLEVFRGNQTEQAKEN